MSTHRYGVEVCPDGPGHYLLRVPELDGTNGIDEVVGQCEDLAELADDAESLIATVLGVGPEEIEIEIHWDNSRRAVEVCRDRVLRAGEIRGQMAEVWNDYIGRRPRRFWLVPATESNAWTLLLCTLEPMPTRLSTLFGEWLYELRAALDGILYQLAVRDSRQNPPPAERSLMFPIFDDPDKFDDPNHRGRLKALSDKTFDLLRHVQPFNAQPDHLSNVLWWLEELSRIDRHRYGHALAPHIDRVRVGIRPPLTLTQHFMPEPFRPFPVDESEPLRIIEVEAPSEWEMRDVQRHIDISDVADSFIDVPEWASRSGSVMSRLDLGARMTRCEEHVLYGIMEPLAAGDITLTPEQSGDKGDP